MDEDVSDTETETKTQNPRFCLRVSRKNLKKRKKLTKVKLLLDQQKAYLTKKEKNNIKFRGKNMLNHVYSVLESKRG